jgi:hypothetical protein
MGELKRKDEELTTADLEVYGISPKQPDGPKLVKAQEPAALNGADALSEPVVPTL